MSDRRGMKPVTVPLRLVDQRADQVMRLKSRLHSECCDDAARDGVRQEIIDLADSIVVRGVDPSVHLLRLVVDELERCWFPERKEGRRRVMEVEVKRADRAAAIAQNRRKGVKPWAKVADDEMAKRWGHNSGKAFNKSIQPARVKRGHRGSRSQHEALGEARLLAFLRERLREPASKTGTKNAEKMSLT